MSNCMPSQARNSKHCATQRWALGIYNAEVKTELFSSALAWTYGLRNKWSCVFGMSLGTCDRITGCRTLAFWNREHSFSSFCQNSVGLSWKGSCSTCINRFLQRLVYLFPFCHCWVTGFGRKGLYLTKPHILPCSVVMLHIRATSCINALDWISQKWFSASGNKSLRSESNFQHSAVPSELIMAVALQGSLSPYVVRDKDRATPGLISRQWVFATWGIFFRGRYFIVSFCQYPKDESCQKLGNGIKFHECFLLHGNSPVELVLGFGLCWCCGGVVFYKKSAATR